MHESEELQHIIKELSTNDTSGLQKTEDAIARFDQSLQKIGIQTKRSNSLLPPEDQHRLTAYNLNGHDFL